MFWFLSFLFTTSVIVPCYHGHFDYLQPLLTLLTEQTSLPDEVVISLSEANQVEESKIAALKNAPWPFQLTLVTTNQHQFPGLNRAVACHHASGELLICQDADDVPHPQRIEIIQAFYDKFHFDHLLHTWVHDPEEAPREFTLEDIVYRTTLPDEDTWAIHNGNCALSRSVLEKVTWDNTWRGSDKVFTKRVYQRCQNVVVIKAPLVFYYAERGSQLDRMKKGIEQGQYVPADLKKQCGL